MGIVGGIEHVVSKRLIKEGKYDTFFNRVTPKSVVGTRIFMSPPKKHLSIEEDLDFTSCRLNDLPPNFAWGVATAAY